MIRRRTAERLAAVGLSVMAVGLGAGIYLALSSAPSDLQAAAKQNAPSPSAASSSSLSETDLPVLWEGHDPARPSPGAILPITPGPAAPFTVQGIIYSETDSCAWLKSDKGGLRICRVGDVVDGWEILEIEPGRVLFSKDGRQMALGIQGRVYPAKAVASAGAAPAQQTAGALPKGRPATSPYGAWSRRSSTIPSNPAATAIRFPSASERSQVDATRGIPRNVADLARNDPSTVMKGLKLEPYSIQGQMKGITLAQVPVDSYAAQYGLAQGDRILAVNGEPLDSASRVYSLYNRYRHSTSVRVTVERAGQVRDVLYYVQ